MVSSKEFRQALPMLGLEVNRADAEALFAEFDTDSSGEIDLAELKKMLRPTAEPDATPGLRLRHSQLSERRQVRTTMGSKKA